MTAVHVALIWLQAEDDFVGDLGPSRCVMLQNDAWPGQGASSIEVTPFANFLLHS